MRESLGERVLKIHHVYNCSGYCDTTWILLPIPQLLELWTCWDITAAYLTGKSPWPQSLASPGNTLSRDSCGQRLADTGMQSTFLCPSLLLSHLLPFVSTLKRSTSRPPLGFRISWGFSHNHFISDLLPLPNPTFLTCLYVYLLRSLPNIPLHITLCFPKTQCSSTSLYILELASQLPINTAV